MQTDIDPYDSTPSSQIHSRSPTFAIDAARDTRGLVSWGPPEPGSPLLSYGIANSCRQYVVSRSKRVIARSF